VPEVLSSGIAVQLLRLLKESFGGRKALVLDSSSWRWCCWAFGVGTGEALGVLEGHADTLQDIEPSSELSAGAGSGELCRWCPALGVGGLEPFLVLALVSFLGLWRVMLKPRWTWSFPLLNTGCWE
jgi:hypothetical protein